MRRFLCVPNENSRITVGSHSGIFLQTPIHFNGVCSTETSTVDCSQEDLELQLSERLMAFLPVNMPLKH